MTVIFFDGPDRSRKTTLAKSVSTILKIPFWERGTFLPHHHMNLVKDGSMDLHQDKNAIWYVVDEMKTIETFKKMNSHVIVDRHPKISECVYRRIEGRPSSLEYDKSSTKDEFVILCHDTKSLDVEHDIVFKTYLSLLEKFEITHGIFDTEDCEMALDKIVEVLYQELPRFR
jgi:hypothetical protein